MNGHEPASARLPSGILTSLFTDIESSTRLLEHLGPSYGAALARHFEILRSALSTHDGHEVDAIGDAYFAVFDQPHQALAAAVDAQRMLAAEQWPNGAALRIRIGVHTGEFSPDKNRELGYVGLDVHRSARISAVAHGGQIVFSGATRKLLQDSALPDGVAIRDLGTHRLKDLRYPETLYDVTIEGLNSNFAPIDTLDNRPNNLPAAAVEIVGREREIERAHGLLRDRDTRLLTLTGPGGVGKTRLSLAIAGGLLETFPSGIFQVPLSAVTEPTLVPPTIAQTLGVQEFPGQSAIDGLKHAIGNRHMLLVIDNFEQVVDAAGTLVDLLQTCENLKLLVTSRETLNVPYESELAVSPMSLAAVDETDDPDRLMQSPAVRLFVERVRDFQPDFAITPENASAIAQICRKLDGLPLAIELAAPRLRLLSPDDLLKRLTQSLDALQAGRRGADQRHRTLRDAVNWSYDLLPPGEKALFRRVAVFVSGFQIEAAEDICHDLDPAGFDVLEMLSSLLSKSLLRRETADGLPRLHMLETVREFGLERLRQSDEYDGYRQRHGDHFLALAETLAPDLLGRQQRRSVGRLLTETDNLRAALVWASEQPEPEATGRLLNALLWLWVPRGQFTEGSAWADRAVAQFAGAQPSRSLGLIYKVAGWLKMMSGDYPGALPLCLRAYEVFGQVGDEVEAARARMMYGITMAATGGAEEGIAQVMGALEQSQALDDRIGAAVTLIAIGEGARHGGDLATARDFYEKALALLRSLDNTYWTAGLLLNLAQLKLRDGAVADALEFLAESIELGREFDYPMVINLYVVIMGAVAHAKGDADQGARLFGAADALLRTLGAALEPPDQAEFDRFKDEAKAALGEQQFAALFAEGASWSRDETIAAATALHT